MKDTMTATIEPNYIIVEPGYDMGEGLIVSDTCAIKRGTDVYCTAHLHALLIKYSKGQN